MVIFIGSFAKVNNWCPPENKMVTSKLQVYKCYFKFNFKDIQNPRETKNTQQAKKMLWKSPTGKILNLKLLICIVFISLLYNRRLMSVLSGNGFLFSRNSMFPETKPSRADASRDFKCSYNVIIMF